MRYVGVVHERSRCGIGHRLVDILQAVIICKWYGLQYAHSPIAITTNPKQGHGAGTFDWWTRADPWEYHLRLGYEEPFLLTRMFPLHTKHWKSPVSRVVELWPHGYKSRNPNGFQLPEETIQDRIRMMQKAVKATPEGGVLVLRASPRFLFPGIMQEHERRGEVPKGLSVATRKWFQDKYLFAHAGWVGEGVRRREGSFFQDDEFAIALLARYGGGHPGLAHRKKTFLAKGSHEKYIPGPHYLRLMTRLRETFPNARMILFTDGPRGREEISPLIKAGFEVRVCFEEYPCLFRVFHSFATADIVFDGNSGTAAMASYMGQGCVLMQPSLPCLRLDPAVQTDYLTGDFDVDELKCKVKEYQNGRRG